MARKIFFVLLIFSLAACGPKPPVSNPSFPALPSKYQGASFLKNFRTTTEAWWESFQDENLNHLVKKLLSQNLDLLEAQARISEARALLKEKRAAQFPRLDFNFRGDRQKIVILAPYFRGGGYITGRFTGSLAASYEVDLWRKLSHATQAARLKILAEEENRLALAQTLVAELVSRYLEGAFLTCELRVLKEELFSQEAYVEVLEERYQAGLADPSVLETERRLLAALKEEVPRLEAEITTRKQQIAVLLGEYPALKISFTLCDYDLPPPPPGLPSDLLLRRPDLRAARARLLSAAEEVASSRAARFPSLSLTAREGRLSNALNTLLRQRNRFWELAFEVFQPLFDAGERKAREEAARARFRALEASYARTVLQAFFEVENALLLETTWRKRLFLAEEQERAACREKEIKDLRYKLGVIPILDYLKARHFCAERKRHTLMIRSSLLLNRVSLYRVLGGGWPKLLQGS